MKTINKDEILLDRGELIYLIRLLGSHSVIGVKLPELIATDGENKKILAEAEKSLIQSGIIRGEGSQERTIINQEVLDMVSVVANRTLAVLTIRSLRGKGQQLFVHNILHQKIVEHTLPKENLHRLALMHTREEFFDRINLIFPLNAVDQKNRNELVISEKMLNEIKDDILKGDPSKADEKLSGLEVISPYRQAMIEAIQKPEYTASSAVFFMAGNEISQASSFSIFADQNTSWGIWPYNASGDASTLVVFPSGIDDVISAFNDWLDAAQDQNEK